VLLPGVLSTDPTGAAMTCDVSCPPLPSSSLSSTDATSADAPSTDAPAPHAPPVVDPIDVRSLTARVLTRPTEKPAAAPLPPSVSTTSLVRAVALWEGVTLSPHAERGVAFLQNGKEIGRVQPDGCVVVPLPEAIQRDLLRVTGNRLYTAGPGAVRVRMDTPDHVRCAAFLLHLSLLYRSIVTCRRLSTLVALSADVDRLQLPATVRRHYMHALARKTDAFA